MIKRRPMAPTAPSARPAVSLKLKMVKKPSHQLRRLSLETPRPRKRRRRLHLRNQRSPRLLPARMARRSRVDDRRVKELAPRKRKNHRRRRLEWARGPEARSRLRIFSYLATTESFLSMQEWDNGKRDWKWSSYDFEDWKRVTHHRVSLAGREGVDSFV